MMVLDFCTHVGKKGTTPVFRTPHNLLQRDWNKVKWPVIRVRDKQDSKKPALKGAGVVIYRFMVNHEAMMTRPGYDKWQLNLYDDPIVPGVNDESVPSSAPGSRPGPTLQQSCEHPDFSGLGLWKMLDEPFKQREKRKPEAELIENYRQLMEARKPKKVLHMADYEVSFERR